MPDLRRAQFLRLRRKAEKCVDVAARKELLGLDIGVGDPVDVARRVKPDISGDAGEEEMRARCQRLDPNASALELDDAVDALLDEQFEAAGMDTAQHGQSLALIDRHDQRGDEIQAEIDFATGDLQSARRAALGGDIGHLGKALGM